MVDGAIGETCEVWQLDMFEQKGCYTVYTFSYIRMYSALVSQGIKPN
jgi:hypothetical protein